MNRRTFLKKTALGVSVASLSSQIISCESFKSRLQIRQTKKSNIILILADDLGFSDIGCYGSEILTPNLDRLAAKGMRFTQFYNTARCCPSRASLLTGLYPHQAGVGDMTFDLDFSGYRGRLNDNCVTIAQVLSEAGYFTAMTGKWHVGQEHGVVPWNLGFDRSLSHRYGGVYFHDYLNESPNIADRNAPVFLDNHPLSFDDPALPKQWYSTDLFTDYGLKFIDEARSKQKPFFLYLAYCAPHFPLQALPEDIARYRGKYMIGWDEIRKQRYARQLDLGIIPSKWKLSPRSEGLKSPTWKDDGSPIPDWDSLSDDVKARQDLRMAIYAAMIDRLDQNIGRIVNYLEKNNELDNTLILFISDNGACISGNVFGFNVGKTDPKLWGTAKSFISHGTAWSNASVTPFRKWKCFTHEGGIATPLIAHWPKGIVQPGTMNSEIGHIIDIMATCLDVAGVEYPQHYGSKAITALEGKSLVPVFETGKREGHAALFWEHTGNRAVRAGRWKLVSEYTQPWELYDMEADRTELNNLADKMPEKVYELEAMYADYANRSCVEPWDQVDAIRKKTEGYYP